MMLCITKGLLLLLVCINNVLSDRCVPSFPKIILPSLVTVNRGSTVNISSDSFQVIPSYYQCKIYFISTSTFSCGAVSPDVVDCHTFSHISYVHYGCDKDTERLDFAVISSDQAVPKAKFVTVEVKVENNTALPVFNRIIIPADAMSISVPLKLPTEDSTCEYAVVSPMSLPYYGDVTGPTGQWLACDSSHTFEYSLHSRHRPQSGDRIIAAVRFANSSLHYIQIAVVIGDSNIESCNNTNGVLPLSFSTYLPVAIEHLLPNCSVERDWRINITKSSVVISAITSYSQHLTTSVFTVEQLQNGLVALCKTRAVFAIVSDPHYYTIHDVYGKPIFNGSVTISQTHLENHLVRIVTNRGIDVLEGQSVQVSSDVLEFVVHNCSDLIISIVEPPKHGHFISAETNATQTQFTIPQDLRDNIIFKHSNNDNYADRAIWEIKCFGNSIGKFLQPIRVTVLDDSPPFLVSKSSMSVHRDGVVQVSFVELQASDVDSCDDNIKYNVSQIKGTLFSSRAEALNCNGAGLLQFYQSDIDHGNVWYRPPDNITITKDVMIFSLSDDSFPPNVLSNQQLKINILEPMNILTALEVPLNSDNLMKIPVVEMANMIVLMPTHFSWFTEQFPWLAIIVLKPPQSGNLSQREFTLDDLKQNKITYRHYGLDQNCKDSFVFQMTNSSGAPLIGKLIISVVNPNVTNVLLQINPLGFSNIRPALAANSINVLVSPVCADHLLFYIETTPKHGSLYFNKALRSIRGSGSWFNLQDLRSGYIIYVYNSSHINSDNSSYEDQFSFSLDSPKGMLTANGDASVNYSIVYTMIDPVVHLNSPSTLYPCRNSRPHHYCYNLSSANINVKSQVANDSEIIIDIQGLPDYGILMDTDGKQSYTFTMLELRNKKIAYEFNSTLWQSRHSMDSFTFFVRVAAQRVRSPQNYTLKLMWNYIYLAEPKLEVNETDGEFSVTVRRRGYVSLPGSIVCTYGSLSGSCEQCGSIKVSHFSPNQTTANCTFPITDNHVADGVKNNFVSLRNPKEGILTHNNATEIFIYDYEDYPVIGFVSTQALVTGLSSCQHGIKVVEGDKMISVELERTGDTSEQVNVKCETVEMTAKVSEDFKGRHKRVTFEPGQTRAFCNVTIVDNNEFEEQEFFQLRLTHPLQRALINQTSNIFCVIIDEDINDRPVVYFKKGDLIAYERRSNYSVVFFVFRSKIESDLTVVYRTVLYENDTASYGDFEKTTSKSIYFTRDQAVSQGSVLVYFDNLNETAETFHIELILGSDYRLGSPSIIKVTIENHISDISIGFKHNKYTIKEEDTNIVFELQRSGNTSFDLTIKIDLNQPEEIMNTRQFFLESVVTFRADQTTSIIHGYVKNDNIYQGTQYWGTYCLVSEDHINNDFDMKFSMQCIEITISDKKDFPSARFEYANYTVQMPEYPRQCHKFAFHVVRAGDIEYSVWSSVKYYTEDDTAIAGRDYVGTNGTLYFESGEKKKDIHVEICSLFSRKDRKFNIHLDGGNISTNLTDVNVIVTPSVAEIIILGNEPVFPDFNERPVVLDLSTVSLLSTTSPSSLICVTPCDPLLPSYGNNTSYCNDQGIDNDRTLYSWEIYQNGSFVPITYSTFFVSPSSQVLYGFYLMEGDRVRCTATAVDTTEVIGYSRCSEAFEMQGNFDCTNSTEEDKDIIVTLQPSPLFTGKDKDTIKVSGSLRRFGNAIPILCAQQHVSFSTLLLLTHFPTRSRSCVLFTGDLNAIINCSWSFEVWLTIKELRDGCNASVSTFGNKTRVKLDLQLVYYNGDVNHASVQDLKNLSVTEEFSHDNYSLLNVKYSKYNAGSVKVLAVSFVNGAEVTFQSVANFTGQFYPSSKNLSSHVNNVFNYSLVLKKIEQSVHACVQTWTLSSTISIKSGLYNISLLPCVLLDSLTWSPSVMSDCVEQEPVVFQLIVPSAARVMPHFDRVETELQLYKRDRNRDRYSLDWKYSPDDVVYIGINKSNKDHHQNFNVTIVICSSAFGYVPHYNPETADYGCLTITQLITHSLTIMEFNNPTGNNFDAKTLNNGDQPLWSFKTMPLSNVSSDTPLWYVHVIYNVLSYPHDMRIIHELRAIYVDKDANKDDTSNTTLCKAIVIVLVLLSVIIVVLMISSFACWKWSRTKLRDEQHCDSGNGTDISTIRRSHRYQVEVQKLPQAFPPPSSIHGNSTEHNMKHTTTKPSNDIANSQRLTGSKKYIVETTM